MKDDKDRIKELEREKKALESALAQSELKLLALESLIETAEEHGLDLEEIRKKLRRKSSRKTGTGR